MKDSPERIQFITEYISVYDSKIKLLNKGGLFDAAKLFELFAIEVGKLYFGQKFSNLNLENFTYPCVDLISEDGQIFIQVSTAKDIPAKINTTLKKIRDSDKDEIKAIKAIKFFVLNNESVAKVKDLKGKNQVGNVPFSKSDDLITTATIQQRATTDLDFQIALHELLQKEIRSVESLSRKLHDAIAASKDTIATNIDCRINNEYEIDRSALISTIASDNHKNISIQGGAGGGKSVLCKKLLEREERVLFARAESFGGDKQLEDIWGFSISEMLERLGDSPIVFFIDALEFIADVRTRLDLLTVLYGVVEKYSNAKIITSCRTSDKKAFLKIENNFSVKVYEVSDLSVAELMPIINKYDVIKKMADMNAYAELLKSPFYINLIVSKVSNIDNISDENQLRDYIWNNVICLNDNSIKKVINEIVLTRAKEFSLGACADAFDTKVIDELVSKEVLVKNSNLLRLKYDIFEDICFEQYFDNEFTKCKGKYDNFFKTIESLGRCVYRRYQIWISNKLLAKSNRERFLSELVFSDKMPHFWQKQTIIGLVKSRYCGEFFSEYGQKIVDKNLVEDFIKITNLYAFEVENTLLIVVLKPTGEGRGSLINLVADKKAYVDATLQTSIEKLCSDYSKTRVKDEQTSKNACAILQHYLKILIDNTEKLRWIADEVKLPLEVIYRFAEYSKEWISQFWLQVEEWYKLDKDGNKRLAEEIIEYSIKCDHIELSRQFPKELCSLAEMYWTFIRPKNPNYDRFGGYERDRHDLSYKYGLSKKAESYSYGHTRNNAINSNFFTNLFEYNFWIGLRWTIKFFNGSVEKLNKKLESEGGLSTYEIYFNEADIKKEYLGYPNMWLATTQENNMPLVLSDLLFCLKSAVRNIMENKLIEDECKNTFAEAVKALIFEKANNIALLTIISDLGMEYPRILPGYALDIVSNIYLVLNDLSRLSLTIKNPLLETLERQMLLAVGLPNSLPDRYNRKSSKQVDLVSYMINSQIGGDETISGKCYKILDYLYSEIPNDEENATEYLQIQKMDLRNSEISRLGENALVISPKVTGEAKKVVQKNEKKLKPMNTVLEAFSGFADKVKDDSVSLNDCLEMIEVIQAGISRSQALNSFDDILVGIMARALSDNLLASEKRAEFIEYWLSGIERLFSNGSFIFKHEIIGVLFSQLELDIKTELKNRIKKTILDLVLYVGQNGIVMEIARLTKRYLSGNAHLAEIVFNTVIKLAEDEMNHQKYNADYISKYRDSDFEFTPNVQPKLRGVDIWIEEAKAKSKSKKYESKENEIINQYLFEENTLDIGKFDMTNHYITVICYAVNSGLPLSNPKMSSVAKKLINAMINVWSTHKDRYNAHKILDVYALSEVRNLFEGELRRDEASANAALDILFSDIDFSKFTSDTVEFYINVFGTFLSEYFDSHSDKVRRLNCEKVLALLESRVNSVPEEKVRRELYKSLILSVTTYGGSGDWSKCQSGYSYQDKLFLNSMFSKYGVYHVKKFIYTVYKLHYNKLLPEILLSVRDVFKIALEDKKGNKAFSEAIKDKETKIIILMIITSAFMDFSTQIKADADLTAAFEEILEILAEVNFEEAAVILDEFRVH